MRLFGTSTLATHVLPLVISLVAIPLAYWAGKDLFDRRAGLAAAALVATNPFFSWYSTETRMYTLVVVLSMAGVTLSWRYVRDRRWIDGAGAVAAFAALLYTHDWGIYLSLVTALVLFGSGHGPERPPPRPSRDRRIVRGDRVVVAMGPVVPGPGQEHGRSVAATALRSATSSPTRRPPSGEPLGSSSSPCSRPAPVDSGRAALRRTATWPACSARNSTARPSWPGFWGLRSSRRGPSGTSPSSSPRCSSRPPEPWHRAAGEWRSSPRFASCSSAGA